MSIYEQRAPTYNKMKVNVVSPPVMHFLVAVLLTGDMYLTIAFNNHIRNMFSVNVYVPPHKYTWLNSVQ